MVGSYIVSQGFVGVFDLQAQETTYEWFAIQFESWHICSLRKTAKSANIMR